MKKNLRLLIMAFLLTLAFLIAGCDGAAPVNPTAPGAPEKATEQSQQPNTASNPERTMQLVVYHATKDAMFLVPETHKVPVNSQPARTAIELLQAGTQNPALVSVMPAGAKVKNLTVKDHIAYVDFDDKLIKKNVGGSTSETLLVGAIVNTLTQFPDIHKVQILVDGKKIDTISGHMDTSEPLSRSEKIIKK
ncbi:GerMN domain-containing protein [Sporomusa sp.]|jgi:spore germination protein GerM|uniref:GerMN domain-containing protein n=1 Tax=Sporomusa sp. TaxID=2078658 RepID=UPI002CDDA58A|nr:GerMN domain-containing protein [Sporomusa sp.]MDF2873692.1 Sporulation and spore germination [Sporomusa sp.]HWR10077.1 GerMN domain-containing protein [Sporomusa sp.]